MSEKEKLVIELDDWDYTCSDGCCSEYGTTIEVNGTELYADGFIRENLLLAVLEHLGYEVTIENTRNGELISALS